LYASLKTLLLIASTLSLLQKRRVSSVFRDAFFVLLMMYLALVNRYVLLLIFCGLSFSAWCQRGNCSEFITVSKRFLKEPAYHSDTTLALGISEGLKGRLEIGDSGKPGAVHFNFVFKLADIGVIAIDDLLSIYFADDTKVEILARMRRMDAGKVSFALLQPTGHRLGSNLSNDDLVFHKQLMAVPISYMELRLDGQMRRFKLTATEAEWIQHVIDCLVQGG
jgi:hypothetical protein